MYCIFVNIHIICNMLEHFQQLQQIFVLFGEWTMIFSFYILSFSNTLPTDSLSHLNIISSFILYHHLFFLYLFPTIIFFNEKCYIYNIFCNTFTTKFMWKVVTNSNLNSPRKLSFFSPILTNNNLLLKIYCENIVVKFLN